MRRLIASSFFALIAANATALLPSRALAQSTSAPRTIERDRQTLIALENDWLAHVRDSAALERILAADFVHAVEPGEFLTKEQHISWSAKHPLPPNHTSRFEKLQVRLYGDVGIASGIVASSDGGDHVARSLFTDVFAYRNGRWQAVHAQETSLAPVPGATPQTAHPIGAQQKSPDLAPYMIADRAAEVALARTAAPASITKSATVLVLTRTGFVEASHGTNGFTCVVFRSFDGATTDPNFWNSKVRAPQCLNPPASRTVLPELVKRAEWIMAGASAAEVDSRTKRAFGAHEFTVPAAGAMAYMLSPHQYLADDDPHWMPHLMFYYDRSLPADAWGAGDGKSPVIDATGNSPSPRLVLLIPVPQWSDGTPAALH